MTITKKILVVFNGDANDPVEYTSPVDGLIVSSVRQALKELSLSITGDELYELVHELSRGRVYWFNETHCFIII